MKKILFILILLSSLVQAQEYTFETIDKRLSAKQWEIREIAGNVVANDTSVTIKTEFNTQVLIIESSMQFYSQDDQIFRCIAADNSIVSIRLVCLDKIKRNEFDLLYYDHDVGTNYFKFHLKKKE